jgi:hypothetical protein
MSGFRTYLSIYCACGKVEEVTKIIMINYMYFHLEESVTSSVKDKHVDYKKYVEKFYA